MLPAMEAEYNEAGPPAAKSDEDQDAYIFEGRGKAHQSGKRAGARATRLV